MPPYRASDRKIRDHRNEQRSSRRRGQSEYERVPKREPRLAELKKDEAPVLKREVIKPHRRGPVPDEGSAQEDAIRQHDRAAEHRREQQ